jgi:hypothetical protein
MQACRHLALTQECWVQTETKKTDIDHVVGTNSQPRGPTGSMLACGVDLLLGWRSGASASMD